MLKAHERLCKCGCGQIISLKGDYVIKEGTHRNSYYASKHHLKQSIGIFNWMVEQGFVKVVKGGRA